MTHDKVTYIYNVTLFQSLFRFVDLSFVLFFKREFQYMASIPDNNSLSSYQNIN